MTETATPEDEPSRAIEALVEAPAAIEPEVAFVIPATAYDRIDTEQEFAPRPGSPGPAVGEEVLAAIRSLGGDLGRRLDGLQTQFDREIRAEATREKVVDRLHAELQEYKQDLLLNTLRPVFLDLIQLHDDIGKVVEARGEADGESGKLLGLLRGFQQGIEDILYRQGVEPFVEPGDAFDPRRQRAVATVPADDPALAKTVASRHRKGFRAGEKVIRPEIVSVYATRK